MRIISLYQGFRELLEKFESCSRKPFIAGVYGVPDSGKTYFIDMVAKALEQRDLKIQQRENQWGFNMYETWTYSANLLRDVPDTVKGQMEKDLSNKDVLLYHHPWDNPAEPWKSRIDAEEILEIFLKRGYDLKLGIYNPKRDLVPVGNYEFIISNPASQQKPMDRGEN